MNTVTQTLLALALAVPSISYANDATLFNVTSSGTPAEVHITLCGNGTIPFTCENFTVTGLTLSIVTTTNAVYDKAGIIVRTPGYTIENLGIDCELYSTGYCGFTVSKDSPKTITLNGGETAKAATNLYVANLYSSPVILMCPLDPSTQLIDGPCVSAIGDSTGPITTELYVDSIALNEAGNRAYLAMYDEANFYQCDVAPSTGLLINCSYPQGSLSSSSTPFNTYYSMIALYPNGGADTYAYLIDYTNETIEACPITGGVMSGSCTRTLPLSPADPIYSYSTGIAFNQLGSQSYAYIGSYDEGYVAVCPINSPTSFGSCNYITGYGTDGDTFNEPSGLAFNPINQLLYIADYDDDVVYACDSAQASSTTFESCVTAGPVDDAWGIVINTQGTMVYVSNYDGDVYQCPIDPMNGIKFVVAGCTALSGFDEPVGMALGYN